MNSFTGASSWNLLRFVAVVRRYHRLVASLLVFTAALVLYVSTMAPGLTWENEGGDGGDFLAAVHTWGIPHPTGYPAYVVLLRVFSEVVRIGDEAFRGNLFSAFVGALTVPIFFLASYKLLLRLPLSDTRGRMLPFAAAVIASLAFTTSSLHWSQSTITEVYALNAMFVALFIWFSLITRARIDKGEKATGARALLALILGFSFGNHVTVSFIAVPFGLWLYWPLLKENLLLPLREWQPVVGLVAGLSIYLYAPIASAQDPALNWFFPDSWNGFCSMASASLYQPYVFGLSPDQFDDRIIHLADTWLNQFAVLGAVLGIAGIMFLWNRLRGFAVAGISSVVALVTYSVAYNSFDSYVFLVPVFIVFGMWVAAGLLNLVVTLVQVVERRKQGWFSGKDGFVVPVVIVISTIGMPVWSMAANYSDIDISDDTEAADYVESALATAGPGAVIIAEDIPTFGLWYQSYVVEPEQDVAVVATFLLAFDWYWEHIIRQYPERIPLDVQGGAAIKARAIAAHNAGARSVFLTSDEDTMASLFELSKTGPLWKVNR